LALRAQTSAARPADVVAYCRRDRCHGARRDGLGPFARAWGRPGGRGCQGARSARPDRL